MSLRVLSFALPLLFPLAAAAVTVPNFSFETPDIVYAANTPPTGWTKVEVTPPQVGLFDNPDVGEPDRIDNMDGTQAVFLFAVPGVALYQEIPTAFQSGTPYTLTLGIGAGGGGMSLGSTLELRLYYRNASNQKVYLGTKKVIFDAAFAAADPAPINHFFDYAVTISGALPSDPWVGKAIGIEFAAVVGTGGYFDLDNVCLVPEPGSAGLLLLGAAVCSTRRRRV